MLQHLSVTEADAQLFGRLASADYLFADRHGGPRPAFWPRIGAGNRACGAMASPAICRSCCCRIGEVARIDLVRQLVRGSWLLAFQRTGGRSGHLERRSFRLSPGTAGPDHGRDHRLRPNRKRSSGQAGFSSAAPSRCPRKIASCSKASPASSLRDSGGTFAEQIDRRSRIEAPAATLTPVRQVRYAAGCRRRAGRPVEASSTAAADSRLTAANTSSPPRPPIARRLPGPTCWPTPTSAPSSASRARPIPGAKTPTNSG